jgi:hypothetical protein
MPNNGFLPVLLNCIPRRHPFAPHQKLIPVKGCHSDYNPSADCHWVDGGRIACVVLNTAEKISTGLGVQGYEIAPINANAQQKLAVASFP